MVKNFKRVIVSVIILIAFVCSSWDVYSESTVDSNTKETVKLNVQSKEKGEIKLNVMDFLGEVNYFSQAIFTFKSVYPKVSVKMDTFTVNTDEDITKYTTKLNTETMAGKGPDIFLYSSFMPISLYKIMNTGIFADINQFIKTDKSFNSDDYYKPIMNCGVYKGKRYLIPLFFSLNMFLTTDEILSKNNIVIDNKHWSIKDLCKELDVLNEKKVKGKKIYFIIPYKDAFSIINVSSGVKLIDFEKRKTYFDTPQFIELLNTARKLNDACLPEKLLKSFGWNWYKIMKNNQLIAIDNALSCISSPKKLWEAENNLRYYFSDKIIPKLYAYPTSDGSRQYSANLELVVAINSKCHYKQLAYAFIKTLISKDVQIFKGPISDKMPSNGFAPVNKKAYEKLLEEYSKKDALIMVDNNDGSETPYLGHPLTRQLVNDIRNIMSSIKTCNIQDNNLYGMMHETVQKYFEGKCTAKEAAKELQNKVTLFLNE